MHGLGLGQGLHRLVHQGGGDLPGKAQPLALLAYQGGISHAAFREAARMVFADLEKLMDGKRPERVVNGL